MPSPSERILITGANGQLGRQLIERLCGDGAGAGGPAVRALVRSERAAAAIRRLAVARPPEVVIGDYVDETAMRAVLAGCSAVVHLVGIIRESRGASYRAAHEDTCAVLARAATVAGVRRIVYPSIVGSTPDSPNACLASKGRAEAILLGGSVPATVLRVPMVLGPGDRASAALRAQASAPVIFLVGGGRTLQQPIDSADLLEAVLAALRDTGGESLALDLGGPERLTHRALVARAAAILGRSPRFVPVPLALVRGLAAAFERLLANPPITVAMLGVLQHDDRVDESKACTRLGLRLTPLDETLRRVLHDQETTADD